MTREWEVSAERFVAASPAAVYATVADPHRMGALSPECIGVWWRGSGTAPQGAKFIGWNRRAAWVWFTECRVVTAEPEREFAFVVTSFGLPIAKWGYRLAAGEGGTTLTEYWEDMRKPSTRGKLAEVLGLVFTGTPAQARAGRNREGMRETLDRVAVAVEGGVPKGA